MDTPSKNGSYLVIAACILAVISLILGIIALRTISDMKSQMGGVGNYAARLDSIETSSRKASDDAGKAVSRIATMSSDTQRAFDNVGKELATLRTSVNRVTIEMKGISGSTSSTGRSTSPKPLTTKPVVSPVASSPASTASTGFASVPSAPVSQVDADGTYTIKSGDTFARLSGLFGVSVQAIEAANPGVDPRRLRIGQKIYIPTDS